jgi:GT2 family glycosyltransferase
MVTWNNQDLLDKCLSSLYESHDVYPFKLLVVDNYSNEETKKLLEKYKNIFPDMEIIYNTENVNYVKGLNQCLQATNTEYFCTIQQDMSFPNKDWLAYMMNRLPKRDKSFVYVHQIRPKTNKRVNAHSFIIKTSVYKDLEIDTNYTLTCEDFDMYIKMNLLEFDIYLSDGPHVFHDVEVIRKLRVNTYDQEVADQKIFFDKYPKGFDGHNPKRLHHL